jgi:hypothetical protein
VKPNRVMKIPSKEEIKIVLSVQPISEFRAYVCMRNDCIYLIALKELQVEQHLNIRGYRIIKTIPLKKDTAVYALASKSDVSLLKNNVISCREKLDKSFILDMDTCELGVVGVTEEGKILFLPLL